MFWETSTDDFNVSYICTVSFTESLDLTCFVPLQNQCGGGNYPIIRTVADILTPKWEGENCYLI